MCFLSLGLFVCFGFSWLFCSFGFLVLTGLLSFVTLADKPDKIPLGVLCASQQGISAELVAPFLPSQHFPSTGVFWYPLQHWCRHPYSSLRIVPFLQINTSAW